METISIKIEPEFLHDIQIAMQRHRYATLSEYIRSAIRKDLKQLEKEEVHEAVKSIRGILKTKTTDKQLHEARERVMKMYEKRYNIK